MKKVFILCIVMMLASTCVASAKEMNDRYCCGCDKESDSQENFDTQDQSSLSEFAKSVEKLCKEVDRLSKQYDEGASDQNGYDTFTAKEESVQHGWLGVTVIDETLEGVVDTIDGACIEKILKGSPLADTEIKEGDLITEIDGLQISSAEELVDRLKKTVPNEKVVLTITTLNKFRNYKSSDYIVRVVDENDIIFAEEDF